MGDIYLTKNINGLRHEFKVVFGCTIFVCITLQAYTGRQHLEPPYVPFAKEPSTGMAEERLSFFKVVLHIIIAIQKYNPQGLRAVATVTAWHIFACRLMGLSF